MLRRMTLMILMTASVAGACRHVVITGGGVILDDGKVMLYDLKVTLDDAKVIVFVGRCTGRR